MVGTVPVELAGRGVKRDGDVSAGPVARLLDGGKQQLNRVAVGAEVGGKAALVALSGGEARLLDLGLQRVEHLGPSPQRLGERRQPQRHQHELLEVDVAVGVGAAVDDVEQRHRQGCAGALTEVGVQLLPGGGRGGLGRRERDAKDGVGAEPALVGCPVKLDEMGIESLLGSRVHTPDRRRNLPVDVGHGTEHALAAVTLGVAVAQLDGLVVACRRP